MKTKQIDLLGNGRKSFCPKRPDRTRFIKTPLHIDEETDNQLTRMAKKHCLSKQELVRQMVKFCLSNEAEKGE